MSGMFGLRPATAGDVARVQEVEVRAAAIFRDIGLGALAEGSPTDAALLVEAVGEGRLWVATLGDEVAGFVHVSSHPDAGHLDELDVLPDAQRRGLGRALVERAAAWAAGAGHTQLTLTTFRDVPWNGPFYRRAGFVDLDEPLPPRLAAIRAAERARGLDLVPRVAMARRLR